MSNPGLWILISLWILWLFPFVVRRRGGGQKATVMVRSARWGMILHALAFAVVWFHTPSQAPPAIAKIIIAILLAALAVVLGFSSTSALGKQWRFDAALNADHALIQTGPYAIVRHPIYASMLLMLIATALIVSNWIALSIALVLYFIGTEIRVRVEEKLLVGHFGQQYQEYRRRTSAYLPGLR